MNKKIFTLSASVLILFLSAFMVNANSSEGFFSAGDMAETRVSAYNAEDDEDIHQYRRLRSVRDDNATIDDLDAPKVLRIVTIQNTAEYLHEDGLSSYSYFSEIGFLGLSNIIQFSEDYIYPDGTSKFNYHLFFDTAYINRGTGNIKPQYMIAVGVKTVKRQEISGKDHVGTSVTKTIKSYVEGRYLINLTDSARELGSDGSSTFPRRNDAYLTSDNRDRLAFVEAIHVYDDDRLYIVSELVNYGVTRDQYIITTESGEEFIDGDALDAMTKTVDGVPGKLSGTERMPDNKMMYGAYYQFSTWNNYHNDVCFSLRFVSPDALNPDESGADVRGNYEKRFYIESEATNRNPQENNKIAPEVGGWIRFRNGAATLERGILGVDAHPTDRKSVV